MKFDNELFYKDIVKRLNRIKKPQRYLSEKQGLSRATLHRISNGRPLKMETFLKVLEWLNFENEKYNANRYIK